MSFENEASYLIDTVEVTKLWGYYDIISKFEKDINIFIGINGSYKTTFIMLIYNLLTLNFTQLIDIDFEKISIKIRKGRSYKYIVFSKSLNNYNEKVYTFSIKGVDEVTISERDLKVYGNQLFDVDEEYDNEFISIKPLKSNMKSKFTILKNSLSQLVNVDYLAINRHCFSRRTPYFYEDNDNSIDKEIEDLVAQFIKYQSEVKTSINNISNNFFKKSFEKLLNNKTLKTTISFDNNTPKKYKDFLNKMSKNPIFKGVDFNDAENYIDETDRLITEVVSGISQDKIKQPISTKLLLDNLNPQQTAKLISNLSNFPKIQIMYDLYEELEKKKQKLEEPTNQFIKISNDFIKSKLFPDKKIIITDDGSLKLQISGNSRIPLYRLSSGEKQLIIILLRTLLQKGKKGIYITDEPELSLHINWQEKLIFALNKINPNSQLILATHSPDIVAEYENKIKQMEDIIKYDKIATK